MRISIDTNKILWALVLFGLAFGFSRVPPMDEATQSLILLACFVSYTLGVYTVLYWIPENWGSEEASNVTDEMNPDNPRENRDSELDD